MTLRLRAIKSQQPNYLVSVTLSLNVSLYMAYLTIPQAIRFTYLIFQDTPFARIPPAVNCVSLLILAINTKPLHILQEMDSNQVLSIYPGT